MSYGKRTEDLETSVGELAILLNDTFTCCIRNYEALLPYLEKKETKPKIYAKLVHINILLNKLNEELVGLRVDYVTVSSYEQKRETIPSEGDRKRRMSDVPEIGRHETKSIKTEVPFSSGTKTFIALTSESPVNTESENLISVDTEETRYTQANKSAIHGTKNIKIEIRDSDEDEDIRVVTIRNSRIPAAQTSCDTINNGVTVSFAGDEESLPVADRFVGDNAYDNPADAIIQIENNEESVPLQNVEMETSNQDKCEEYGHILTKDCDIYRGGEVECTTFPYQTDRSFNRKEPPIASTTSNRETDTLLQERSNIDNEDKKNTPDHSIRSEEDHLLVQRSEELCNAGDVFYGVIRHKFGSYRCTLCNRKLVDFTAALGHVRGKKHKMKQETVKKAEVSNKSCKIPGKKNKMKRNAAKKAEVPNKSCESSASVSVCSDVYCSLDDSVAVVEERHQVISMKHAVTLDDMWKYFDATFHINKKFFRIHSGQVKCYLCNEHIGRFVFRVKNHLSSLHHLHRIKVLTKTERRNKYSNKNLLDIPGILSNIIPTTQFSLENKGFFCRVCNCFCENELVLSHMTGFSHFKKAKQNETINGEQC